MESMPELTFNIDAGYLEGLCRGFKGGILKQADYLNIVQCETLEEIESELEDDGGDPGFVQDFKFQQEGQMVAVYFHEDFYIGEVVWVLSEDNGEINFMEKAKQVIKGREVFRWPSRTDQCEI
ncbi:hypothetical protein LSH36_915g00072 [Paralvinella palmiformis]|uniref:Uncharacterized protein n=1 Tax=Paralvinella palmiformis TaxID=53620 RepID=A0AAD9IZ62_9ANNE|nr:hypothetical protein LSH36_915g00072 [Paralvinella palmiformis]